MQNRRIYTLILTLIFLFGGILTFVGDNWGLPVQLHPDEWTIVSSAVKMVKNKTFEPDVFYRPDHLLIQINMLAYKIVEFALQIPFEELVPKREDILYLTARIITGFFAVASIFVSYLLGKRHSREAGLVCAFLFAFFPIYVTHSHYATPDIPITFFILLFILMSYNYLENPTVQNLFFMSLVTSAFIATKYTGAILCLMIAITVICAAVKEKRYSRILSHGVISAMLVIALLFLISPVLFIKFTNTKAAFIREAASTHLGADGLGTIGNALYYFRTYINASGIILPFFFIYGAFTILSDKKSNWKRIPVFYSFIYWVCLSIVPLHWERWALPMYVSPLLVSAVGIANAYSVIKSNPSLIKSKLCCGIFSIAISLAAINFVTGAVSRWIPFMVTDTRLASRIFCAEKGISRENTAFESYSPINPAGAGHYAFAEKDNVYYLQEKKIKYVIFSSYMYGRFQAEPERYAKENAFYQSVKDNFTLIKQYKVPSITPSPVDFFNICNNIGYVYDTITEGISGPELLFYEAGDKNYLHNGLSRN